MEFTSVFGIIARQWDFVQAPKHHLKCLWPIKIDIPIEKLKIASQIRHSSWSCLFRKICCFWASHRGLGMGFASVFGIIARDWGSVQVPKHRLKCV
jgi:hypothetical protein